MNKVILGGNHKSSQISLEDINKIIDESLKSFCISNSLTEVLIVDAEEIHGINKKYRSIDKATDVLSFPQIMIPGQKERLMGSIVICPEIIAQKEEDLKDVIKHGLLHLLGFDHETDEKKWLEAAAKIDCKF